MWARYAEDHQGIVLRIVPNLEKDSKFQKFAPVVYRQTRPSLYESAASFQEDSLFGDQQTRMKKALDAIIYSKTLEWEYECEYRLAIALGHGEKDWNTLTYHPNEIAELYLGAKMTGEFKAEIIGVAQAANPQIKIFEMFYDASGKLHLARDNTACCVVVSLIRSPVRPFRRSASACRALCLRERPPPVQRELL